MNFNISAEMSAWGHQNFLILSSDKIVTKSDLLQRIAVMFMEMIIVNS